jgi:hypothetical protein
MKMIKANFKIKNQNQMKRNLSIVMLLATMIIAGGCASIVSKSNYPFTVNSLPQGADVTVVNKKGTEVYRGNTPAQLTLKSSAGFFSKASYLVTIEMEGYQTRTVPVDFVLDGWYFGNILFGGLIGILIVDPATGAMWRLKTEFVDITLQAETLAGNTEVEHEAGQHGIEIYTLDEIPEEWKAGMIRFTP